MKTLLLLCALALLVFSTHAQVDSIKLTLHPGSNEYWCAVSSSDTTVTAIQIKDSSENAEWLPLTATTWGYWTWQATGSALIFPISVQISSDKSSLNFPTVFADKSVAGNTYDTGAAFPSSSPVFVSTTTTAPQKVPAPSKGKVTAKPTKPATKPATPKPATPKPATPTKPETTTPKPVITPKPSGGGSSSGGLTLTGNPFVGAEMYLLPYYAAQVSTITATTTSMANALKEIAKTPVAFWIDTISKISALPGVLEGAAAQQAATGKNVAVTIVIYDLPNRDCAALASNGEISCADSTCAAGINKYKNEYISSIIAILKQHPTLSIIAIVEPDSLPNLVTNLNVPKCANSVSTYKTCVAYAIQQLSTLSNVAIYVDAAHGGWLGWTNNLAGMATIFAEVLNMAGGASKIRGFSTNVANYQALGSLSSTVDPCGLGAQYNFAINEVAFTNLLSTALSAAGITNKHFIIDTSRNGVPNSRTSCSNWCNINKAGLGARPTVSPQNLGVNNIDALVWVKPPGEADGTSDTSAVRYDAHCGSADSVIPAPEAGNWFPSYFTMLVQNANPAF